MVSGKWQMVSGKWQVVSGKWQMGEPDDDTNFGSHANPGIGSHFGQTKFLVIYPASCVTEEGYGCLEHNK